MSDNRKNAEAMQPLDSKVNNLHGVTLENGWRRITPEGLAKSLVEHQITVPFVRNVPAGVRWYCSCCGEPKTQAAEWLSLVLCRECIDTAKTTTSQGEGTS